MIKVRVCFLFLFASSLSLYGQEQDSALRDKIYFGGNFGLSLGTITYVDVSPLIGYRISDNYSAGVTLSYQYFRDKRFDVSGDVLGYGVFNRLNLTEEIFLYAEFQNLSYSGLGSTVDNNPDPRINVPFLWLGGGYSQRLGQSSALFVSFLYDVIQDPNGRFQNPQIRGGITFGI